jgi:hypothetical protein
MTAVLAVAAAAGPAARGGRASACGCSAGDACGQYEAAGLRRAQPCDWLTVGLQAPNYGRRPGRQQGNRPDGARAAADQGASAQRMCDYHSAAIRNGCARRGCSTWDRGRGNNGGTIAALKRRFCASGPVRAPWDAGIRGCGRRNAWARRQCVSAEPLVRNRGLPPSTPRAGATARAKNAAGLRAVQ